MRFAATAYREYLQEQSFRVYLTDAVRLAVGNTARIGGGVSITARWADIAETRGGSTAYDARPAAEIVADVAQKAGITITHG